MEYRAPVVELVVLAVLRYFGLDLLYMSFTELFDL